MFSALFTAAQYVSVAPPLHETFEDWPESDETATQDQEYDNFAAGDRSDSCAVTIAPETDSRITRL